MFCTNAAPMGAAFFLLPPREREAVGIESKWGLAVAWAACALTQTGCVVEAPAPGMSVSLAVVDANVWTGDRARPWVDAIAVADDRIVAVGSSAAVRELAGNAPVIEGRGRMVVPGFIDAHAHLIQRAYRLLSVQLRDTRSERELAAQLTAFAASVPYDTWITGGDWDHHNWGGRLPDRAWIDDSTPDHLVWMTRLDGHMGLANTRALEEAGISRDTPDPAGGVIVRNAAGEPTGVLKDNAMRLVTDVIPRPTPEAQDQALTVALAHLAEQGVTSVHHMGSWDDLETFARAAAVGRLTARVYAAVPLESWERLRATIDGSEFGGPEPRGDDWLRLGVLKGFVDGSLGSHTAAFDEPYLDTPEDTGVLLHDTEQVYAWIAAADRAGLQVAMHAVGDRANRLLLDIYERVARENGPRDRRFRIEHAQHLHPMDVLRLARLEVVASMQPYHVIDDARWAEQVIGPERAQTTYAFRSLLDAGARVTFGSDWSVAPVSALEGMYAAVMRRPIDGSQRAGWVPTEKITIAEALDAYTVAGAFASFEEDRKGRLAVGYLADFVILEDDLLAVPSPDIRRVPVMMTVVGGQVVYDRRAVPDTQ